MLSIFDIAALLLTLSTLFAWVNYKVLHLPNTIGVLVIGLASSLALIGLEYITHVPLYDSLVSAIGQIDFTAAFMNGMLAFLLFAGALHVDFSRLKQRALPIAFLATAGVLISTAIVGGAIYIVGGWLGLPMTLAWALVFGALISPTDPVAVLSTLKSTNLPETLESEISGEALFNDGAGIVLFTILLAVAVGMEDFSIARIGGLFLFEALGGALLGLVLGYIAFRATAAVEDFPIEIMISLALVMATYAIATHLNISGPIAVVTAGVFLGERGPAEAMSDRTKRYMFRFWTLIDEILSSVLFLLIGLEVLVINFEMSAAWLALAAIPIVLAARFVSVAAAAPVVAPFMQLTPRALPILTWAGVRGAISVALALALPPSDAKTIILAATYAVVLFTLIVQGLTLAPLARSMFGTQRAGKNGEQVNPGSVP